MLHECSFDSNGVCGTCGRYARTTSTLDGKWPSDTWFQRARARRLKEEAAEIEASNELSKV